MRGDEVVIDGIRFLVTGEHLSCDACLARFSIGSMDFGDGQGERIFSHEPIYVPAFCPRCGAAEPAHIETLAGLED